MNPRGWHIYSNTNDNGLSSGNSKRLLSIDISLLRSQSLISKRHNLAELDKTLWLYNFKNLNSIFAQNYNQWHRYSNLYPQHIRKQ